MSATETMQTTAAVPQAQNAERPAETNSILTQAIEATVDQQMAKLEFEEKRFTFQQRRAKMFANSGLFASVKDLTEEAAIAQAMVKIELGESMGFSPAESLQGIAVINGQTAVSAALRAARMKSCGYDWDIQWHGTDENPLGVTLWLKRNGQPLTQPVRNEAGAILYDEDGNMQVEWVHVSFKRADAEKMLTTIWENNQKRRASILEKDNWKMTPKNMYFARAVTNAQRWHAPEALSVNLPSVEEAQDRDEDAAEEPVQYLGPRGSREAQQKVLAEKLATARAAQPQPPAERQPEKGDMKPDERKQPEAAKIDEEHQLQLLQLAESLGVKQDALKQVVEQRGFKALHTITVDKYPAIVQDLKDLAAHKDEPAEDRTPEPEQKTEPEKSKQKLTFGKRQEGK